MSESDHPLIPPGSQIFNLRVIGDDVEADLPVLNKPYAMRILNSLYDHAASKVECPYYPHKLKPEAAQAIDELCAADLIIKHPAHDAQVTPSIVMLVPTIALTERGRNVVETYRNRKLAASAADADILS